MFPSPGWLMTFDVRAPHVSDGVFAPRAYGPQISPTPLTYGRTSEAIRRG